MMFEIWVSEIAAGEKLWKFGVIEEARLVVSHSTATSYNLIGRQRFTMLACII